LSRHHIIKHSTEACSIRWHSEEAGQGKSWPPRRSLASAVTSQR